MGGSASKHLRALIDEFYGVWFRFHQEAVLKAGIPGFTGDSSAVDDDGMGALGSWLESAIVGLEEIDFQSLDVAEKLDLELLFGACRDEYQAILERDWRHRDPLGFMPFHTICRMVQDPTSDSWSALGTFLKGTPELLRQARANLAQYPMLIPPIWVKAALKEGQAGMGLLGQLGSIDNAPSAMRSLCDQVSEAVGGYLTFLEQEIAPAAKGTAACGWQRFQEQLRLRHHLPDKLGDHLDLARQLLQQTYTELSRLTFEQTGSSDTQAWLDKLAGENSLRSWSRLDFVRQRSAEIQQRLSASGEFQLSGVGGLDLRMAPADYPLDCAPIYWPSARPEQSAILYLQQTPLDCMADSSERLTAWCMRNAWPGRHLQAASAEQSPLATRLVRRLNSLPSQQIGWALYTEQLLIERNFYPAPEQALHCLLERLRRSLMAVLDIELHVYEMEPDAVLQQLRSLPGSCAEGAARDLLSLTRHPTQHLAAIVNWKLLEALKQWQLSNGVVRLADLHGQILAQGSIALPLIIRRVFGQQAWDSVESQVYSQ